MQLYFSSTLCSHLMTDPKSRKVIVLENPLMPTRIKEMIARRLFEDFRVRRRFAGTVPFRARVEVTRGTGTDVTRRRPRAGP